MVNLHAGMQLALAQARVAYSVQQIPIGAAITSRDGNILALAHNNRNLMLGHAEVLALLQCEGPYAPEQSTLFVTLEPCPLCASAILNARVSQLVFGAYDPKGGGVEHGPRLLDNASTQVIGGIQEAECATLLQSFFLERRSTSSQDCAPKNLCCLT